MNPHLGSHDLPHLTIWGFMICHVGTSDLLNAWSRCLEKMRLNKTQDMCSFRRPKSKHQCCARRSPPHTHTHTPGRLFGVYVGFSLFSVKISFLVYTKPRFCLLRHLSFFRAENTFGVYFFLAIYQFSGVAPTNRTEESEVREISGKESGICSGSPLLRGCA